MNIPWAILVPIIVEVIGGCMNRGASPQAIRNEIRDPSPRAQFALGRAIRRELNWSWMEWKREGPELLAALRAQGQMIGNAEIDDLIDEASACCPRGD